MSARRPTRRLLLLAAALSFAAMGSDYRGCGSAPAPPDGVPLPMAGEGCIVDTDCGLDECTVLACVSGECVPAGARFDADGDGYSPPPCGDDCSDGDSTVFPGSAEICDGLDQDCDAMVDEDAPGAVAQRIDDGLSGSQIVGLDAGFAVVGRTADGSLGGYVLARDGEAGPAVTLFTPAPTDPRLERLAAASDGGRVVVAFALEGGPPQRIELQASGLELGVLAPAAPLGASGDATALAVHVLDGEAFVAFDTIDGAEVRRALWREASGALTPLVPGETGPFLGDDGTNLVVASADAGLEFLAADASPIASQTLPGALASGQAIARSDGGVVAAYRDSFDHNLTTVTTSTIRSPTTAPLGPQDDVVSVHALAEGVLVTRVGAELLAWILAPDLRTYVASFPGSQLSPIPGPPSRASAATDGEGTSAILASYEGVSSAVFLRCDTAR